MPKKTKTAPKPVPSQDETQFKASMVVDAKPKLKNKDIFEDMNETQKRMKKHSLDKKAIMKERKKEHEKKKRVD